VHLGKVRCALNTHGVAGEARGALPAIHLNLYSTNCIKFDDYSLICLRGNRESPVILFLPDQTLIDLSPHL
jgi:hypothetical protein